MATVHKEPAHTIVPHKGSVVHTVIHEEENRGSFLPAERLDQTVLTFEELFDSILFVLSIDEKVRNKLLIVSVSILSAGHGYPRGDVLLVPKDVSHEC